MTIGLVIISVWLGYYVGRTMSRNECRDKLYELESDLEGWKHTAKRQSELIRMSKPHGSI